MKEKHKKVRVWHVVSFLLIAVMLCSFFCTKIKMPGAEAFRAITLTEFLNAYGLQVIVAFVVAIFIAVIACIIRNEQKIRKLMYKDTEMDIWNLNYFVYRGEHKLLPERKKNYAAVMVNINQYRRYSIIFGRDAAAQLLVAVADVIKKRLDTKEEIYARYQEVRFVLLLAWEDWEQFRQRMEELQEEMEKRIHQITGSKFKVSLGVYAIPQNSKDVRDALNEANEALVFVREDCTIVYYDDELERTVLQRNNQDTLLENVNIEENFIVYYQPKVDIRTNEIIGAEALVRFVDPSADGAIRAPGFFVPYYERTGKIKEIDFFVLEMTCRMLRRRIDQGKKIVPVSCNFSRKHFLNDDFPERFEQVLDKYGISKEMIEVEITETLVVEELQYSTVKKTLEELRQKHIKLAIDDFGAGYSSLGIFEQIPASVIKLDRSFFLNKENKERQVKVMRGIVKLVKELDAKIVCEGVETEEDIKIMNEIGAYIAQGYFYSKPVSEGSFEEKLDSKCT